MRVLLSTIGSRGDVQPLVALGSALRSRGHDARFCVPPDFRQWIERLGFPVTPIGPELRSPTPPAAAPATAAPPSPERRRQLAEATVAAQFAAVATAAAGCDAIVAATALQIAARSVAEHLGIRYVFAAYCPCVLPSALHAPPRLPALPGQPPEPPPSDNRERWARDADRFHTLFGAPLNAHRRSIGLSEVDDTRSHVFSERPWLAADATLAPWPDRADDSVFQPGAWILPDDRPLPPEVERFLDAGEPPVYAGFGSMRAPQGLGELFAGAARAVGRRAIVSRGWADLTAAADAQQSLLVDDINQQALFPRVAVVVHHGGAGTTTAAAMAGVPQVIVPQFYDQHYWAERVEALSIGAAHAAGAPTVDSLAAALDVALQPEVAGRARVIASAMRLDGADAAVDRLVG